jgi:hypothetical protein
MVQDLLRFLLVQRLRETVALLLVCLDTIAALHSLKGYTDAWGSIGGGGGTNTFTTDSFTGNGSTTAYALSQTVSSEDNLLVFIEGVFQQQDAYSIATAGGTTTLTFSSAPANGNSILIYSVAAGVSGSNLNIDSMTGDGSDTTLTLSINPVNENNTQVFIDGVYQSKSNYSISGTTLTFSTAPPNGSAVEVMTMTQTDINVPVDGTITSAKIASGDFYFDTNTLYIDATNNRVGIGTSSPTRALSVFGDTAGVISITSNSTDGISSLSFGDTADDNAGRVNYLNASDAMLFYTAATERMRLDQNGTLLLTTPFGGAYGYLNIKEAGSGDVRFGKKSGNDYDAIAGTWTNNHFSFYTNSTERMRIDSSGNLLVGTSTTNIATEGTVIYGSGNEGVMTLSSTNMTAFYVNRSNQGELVQFRSANTTVGSIATWDGEIAIGRLNCALLFDDDANRIKPHSVSSNTVRDNALDLGGPSARFDDIYATNGTIQTSDRNEKQDIEALSDAEQRVAVAAKGLLRKFRWISSVEENGDDARIHFGIIAQDLQDAFTAEGLDAGRYAMFISSTWTDEETGEERTRLGVRYSELLAFIISAI